MTSTLTSGPGVPGGPYYDIRIIFNLDKPYPVGLMVWLLESPEGVSVMRVFHYSYSNGLRLEYSGDAAPLARSLVTFITPRILLITFIVHT